MTKRTEGKTQGGPKLRPGSHAALLFGDPGALADALAFAAGGALGGEACAFLAYSRFNERAAAQLRDLYSVDVRRSQADNLLAFLDARETARELKTELTRFFEQAQRVRRPARLVTCLGWGEAGWPDDDELLRFEVGLNDLCREHSVAALCLYDARQLNGGLILDGALACHPTVISRGRAIKNPFVIESSTLLRELGARRRGEDRLRAWMT